jgi:hypothetical protein
MEVLEYVEILLSHNVHEAIYKSYSLSIKGKLSELDPIDRERYGSVVDSVV